jgi:hypothetical protein
MTRPASGHKGISRIDHEGKHTHGWYVRVCFDRKLYSRFFSDGAHGGKEKALKKALKHRNDLEKQLGKPRTDRIIVVSNNRNSTGIIGVQRVHRVARLKNGAKISGAVYEVTWSPEPNVIKKTSFSIEKFGEEGAFYRAVELRQKVEKKVYGRVIQTRMPSFEEVKNRLDAKPTVPQKKPKAKSHSG